MNLLDLAVKLRVDDEASGEISGISSNIIGTLSGAAAKAGALVATVAAAAVAGGVAIGNAALNAYGSYEQLVGGVDTLFKESSNLVQQYADNAYKTAGLSANDYMETITGFSASLLQSLGGDTKKAADYGDMAIRDMSDNANKMGTSMESIQYAYQGFAKQNYTMLDNLKLGYGGTKTEMERLIEEANKVKEANGQMADLSIDSFADVVEAIHIIQKEMGILGTTTDEAEGTIEGSTASMSAAWNNWLTEIAKTDGDIATKTDQLVEAVIVSLSNLVPRAIIIAQNLGSALLSELPTALAEIGSAIKQVLPESAQEAIDGVTERLSGLAEAWSVTVEPLAELFSGIWDVVGNAFEYIVGQIDIAFLPALENLGTQFGLFIEALQPYMPVLQLVANMLGAVLVAAATMLVDAITLVVGIVRVALNALSSFVAAIPGWIASAKAWISNFVTNVKKFFTVDIPAAIKNMANWFKAIPGNIANALRLAIVHVISWVKNMKNKASEAGQGFKDAVKLKFNQVVTWFGNLPTRIVTAIGDLGSTLYDAGTSIISGLWNGLKAKWGEVSEWFGTITAAIPKLKGPEDVDAALLVKNGQLIIEGLARGMQSEWANVEKFLSEKTADIGGSFSFTSRAIPVAAGVATTGDTVYKVGNIYVTVEQLEDIDTIDDFIEIIKRAKRNKPTRK